jgi:hypothetical protein
MESGGVEACRSRDPVVEFVVQILIRFPDKETEQTALGKLIPRFSGKSWATGETAVPSPALGFLAEHGVKFSVIGPAPYELVTPLRDPGAVAVK